MKETLYLITNISMSGLVKIGVTNNVEARLKSLNKTNLPTKFQIYETFDKLKDPEIVEQEVLEHYADLGKRPNKKREFIQEHPELICEFIREHKNLTNKPRDEQWTFEKLGINQGETIIFTQSGAIHPKIKATIVGDRKIKYRGKEGSLTGIALDILNSRFVDKADKPLKSVRGPTYWRYDEKKISELIDGL